MPSIVQFIHPQAEHSYDSHYKNKKYYKKWHNGDHCRKFVINKGKYIENDLSNDGILLFWCEWEPPSLVEEIDLIKRTSSNEVYPKYLHYPFLPSLEKIKYYQKNGFQNTDPFVFGKYFKYSNCKQDHYPCMRNLEKGSLLLFGSCVKSCFVIDTVFVVKEVIPYCSPVNNDQCFNELGSESNIFSEIVLKMFCKDGDNVIKKQRILYIGATYEDTDDSINKMYSFVPSMKYEGIIKTFPRLYLQNVDDINNYFIKYTMGKKKIINDKLTQGLLHNPNININDIEYLWNIIKNNTLKKYVLGYNFEMPKEGEIIKL